MLCDSARILKSNGARLAVALERLPKEYLGTASLRLLLKYDHTVPRLLAGSTVQVYPAATHVYRSRPRAMIGQQPCQTEFIG
jgi:hypothetical protein